MRPWGSRTCPRRGTEGRDLASGAARVYRPLVSWWRRFAALFLVVGAVVWPDLASAATGVQLETRVGGIELVVHALVGGSSARSPEKHLGTSPAYDEIALGYSLAAEEGGEIVRESGGVDFSQSTYLHPSDRAVVQIGYTGSYPLDAQAANAEAGFARTPAGYTWHHLDDYDAATNKGTMQLVQTFAHQGMSHFGGVNQWERITGLKYLSPWNWW